MRTARPAILWMLLVAGFVVTGGASEDQAGVRAEVLAQIESELARLSKQAETETGPAHPRPSSEVAFLVLSGLAAQGTQVPQPAAEELHQLGITYANRVAVQVFTVADDARIVIRAVEIQDKIHDKSGSWTSKRATLHRRQSGKWVERGSGQSQASDKESSLFRGLDEIVKRAEKKVLPTLPEEVKSAEQALKHASAEYAEQYRVLEHKGWWIVAWHGDGRLPCLWLPGFAIRKNSKDFYRFGSW